MVSFKYSTTVTEHMAKASLRAEAISTKHSIEICNMVRGLSLSKAKTLLNEVVAMKKPVPFKRFNDNVGHRRGMGPGRYPTKAASKILDLLNGVTANAQVKGLDTDALLIKHINSHYASRPMRAGRHRGRVSKRTHVEIVVEESAKLKTDKKPQKSKVQKKEIEKKSDVTVSEKTKTTNQPKKEEAVVKETKVEKESPKSDEKKPISEKKDDKESVKENKVVENKKADDSNNSKGAKND